MYFTSLDRVMIFSKLTYEITLVLEIQKIIISILINTLIYFTRQSDFSIEQYETFYNYLKNLSIPEGDLHVRNSLFQIEGFYDIEKSIYSIVWKE